ncbi:glycosyltransferase [Plantactinospora sp. DSM 117369]
MASTSVTSAGLRRGPFLAAGRTGPGWVLMFSGSPWRAAAHRQHALAQELTVDWRVIFVDPPGNRPRWRCTVRPVGDSLWHAVPPAVLPLGRHLPVVNRLTRRVEAALLDRWLRQHTRRLAGDPPRARIVWLDEDLAWPVAARLDPTTVVYDATDLDWTFTRRWNRPHLRRALRAAVAAADLVLASSSALPERLPATRHIPVVVANGCDPHRFTADGPVATALAGLPRPILGYLGAVDTRAFDADLVATVARNRPEWTFVLVGPSTRAGRAPLAGLPNVRLRPPVPFADAPAMVRGFDIGIIPYRVGGLVDYVHPKKCFEYLAAGRPVVATPLPALRDLGEPVRLAATATRFEAAVEEELRTAWCPEAVAVRRATAARHSWATRGTRLRKLLTELAELR